MGDAGAVEQNHVRHVLQRREGGEEGGALAEAGHGRHVGERHPGLPAGGLDEAVIGKRGDHDDGVGDVVLDRHVGACDEPDGVEVDRRGDVNHAS